MNSAWFNKVQEEMLEAIQSAGAETNPNLYPLAVALTDLRESIQTPPTPFSAPSQADRKR